MQKFNSLVQFENDSNDKNIINVESYYKTEIKDFDLEYKIIDGVFYGKGYDNFNLFGN